MLLATVTLDTIRQIMVQRNKKLCRPKFLVKPKPKNQIAEFKSLRFVIYFEFIYINKLY